MGCPELVFEILNIEYHHVDKFSKEKWRYPSFAQKN